MAGFGGAVKLTGESEYRRALNQITQNLKELSAEMRTVSSAYDKNDKSVTALSAQEDVLNRKLEEQKAKLSVLNSEYSSMSARFAEQTAKHNQLTQDYEREKQKLDEIGRTLGTTSAEYNAQKAVVDQLGQELRKSTQAQDANEKSMSKMRIAISDAQTDINKTTRELANLSKEEKEAGDNAEKAGSGGFTVLKGALANLTSSAIMGAINALKQLGGYLVNLGKQAVSSYAEYEQLVGGVQTLFGGDAGAKVMENANKAFATAGMSANKYMETVTSFSASLIQSLGGDTMEASKVADRAIKDMSDNANKMGTDMQMIQNAYQGFAKQNYTMLDNLKLGYGGNKTEMERLIADASRMTEVQKELGITVEEGNMSFANIANAISVVQRNMGIMGTTALEASDTIQGSAYSFRASWQNLLTGMADDNADFEGLVQTFIESLMGMLENMLPRVMQVVQGMGNTISAFIEQILPQLIEVIVPFVQTIVPQIANLIVNNLPMIIDAGIQLIIALLNGIIEALPQVIEMMPTIVKQLAQVLIKNAPAILKAGVSLIGALAQGIKSAVGKVLSAVRSIGNTIVNQLKTIPSKVNSVGANIVKGIWNGISNGLGWIKGKIKGWIGNVTSFIKNVLGISSPSKLYRDEIGLNLAKGVGEGFEQGMNTVANQMKDAIPTSIDATTVLRTSESASLVGAFKQALAEMKIILDDEVAGHFVETTVTRLVYQ